MRSKGRVEILEFQKVAALAVVSIRLFEPSLHQVSGPGREIVDGADDLLLKLPSDAQGHRDPDCCSGCDEQKEHPAKGAQQGDEVDPVDYVPFSHVDRCGIAQHESPVGYFVEAEFLLADGVEPIPVEVALLLNQLRVGVDDELSEFVQDERLAPNQVLIHLVIENLEAQLAENEAPAGKGAGQDDPPRSPCPWI